jgi:Family of unknown function (DUF5519)
VKSNSYICNYKSAQQFHSHYASFFSSTGEESWSNDYFHYSMRGIMNTFLVHLINTVEDSIVALEQIQAGQHERGGREFVWNTREIGHIHWNGDLDILFNKNIRTALVQEGIMQIHKWVPQSGWTTFPIENEIDIQTAIDLLRLSYYHKRLRKSSTIEEQQHFATQIRTASLSVS